MNDNKERIEIYSVHYNHDKELTLKLNDLYHGKAKWIRKENIFWIESNKPISKDQIDLCLKQVFCDPVLNKGRTRYQHDFDFPDLPDYVIEISFLPGVTDNTGRMAKEALQIAGIFSDDDFCVYSGIQYFINGINDKQKVQKMAQNELANTLLQKVNVQTFGEYIVQKRFKKIATPKVDIKNLPTIKTIPLHLSDEEFFKLSESNCWAFSLDEIKHLKSYFNHPNTSYSRQEKNISPLPTDAEIEVIAQTWSEHCKHKIFSANIDYKEDKDSLEKNSLKQLDPQTIEGLYPTYIKNATHKIVNQNNIDWTISVFKDNAGIVRFDKNLDISVKVETHNSPSALDPYGGSLTGILGVNRDILGVGLSSRPVANTNVFCLGYPNEKHTLPEGLKHPKNILGGVHKGIEDGGNKSGIPTVNGAITFHQNYSGKPLIFCGTVGVHPRQNTEKKARPGDKVVMAGGAIGKDGIHGATFSSLELDENSPLSAVQIGDPLTQKRLSYFIKEAAEKKLFSSITDNGAGGLSSSVGEMAGESSGVRIELSKAPLKYEGLAPFEILVSESQERMTFAVPPEKIEEFNHLAQRRGVDSVVLGEFTDSGYFEVYYKDELAVFLSLDFLHDSLPKMNLKAYYQGPVPEENFFWYNPPQKIKLKESFVEERYFWNEAIEKILTGPNIQSKEHLVRQYDHEVLAATHIKPFVGSRQKAPGNSGVISLAPHGGEEKRGVAIGCGMAPRLSYYDGYTMAQYSLDEAVRNLVAVGGDPSKVALVDNFCWPNPEQSPDITAILVRTCAGLHDLSIDYKMPLISGKDSMKNDFKGLLKGDKIKISVPPTLLITAIADVPDLDNTVTTPFKHAGDLIYLVGLNNVGLEYTEFSRYYDFSEIAPLRKVPSLNSFENLEVYQQLFKALQNKVCSSVHDVSEGGFLTTIVESMIGEELGASIDRSLYQSFPKLDFVNLLFNEAPGRFLISINPGKKEELENIFKDKYLTYVGTVTKNPYLQIPIGSTSHHYYNYSLKNLESYWGGLSEKTN